MPPTIAKKLADTFSTVGDNQLHSLDRRALNFRAIWIIHDNDDTTKWIFADDSAITSVNGKWHVEE
jgi:hypothetical protein